ncbi:hypothetical protein EV131_12740 [Rhizobium laguerreae]|nr:hypothetical protein EV131_12740 [Rhizobium laguerreae]
MVDHTQYDTTSIIRFITARYDLPVLPGRHRPRQGAAQQRRLLRGDLTAGLNLSH